MFDVFPTTKSNQNLGDWQIWMKPQSPRNARPLLNNMAMAFIWLGKPKHGGGVAFPKDEIHLDCTNFPRRMGSNLPSKHLQHQKENTCPKIPKKKWSLVILVHVFLWENGRWWFLYYKAYFSGAVGVYLQPMNPAVQKKTSHVEFDHCTIWVPKNATILQFAVCNIFTFHYAGSIVAMPYKVTFNIF